MKNKWFWGIIFVLCCGMVAMLYAFPSTNLLGRHEEQEKRGQEMIVLSGGSVLSEASIAKESEKDTSINQHIFTGNDAKIKDLGALDDHGIAQAVGFYATYGDDFISNSTSPSMFSCEDVDTERLKQPMKHKCRWYEIKYKPFSFIFSADKPLLSVENGKIYLKNNHPDNDIAIEIAQYDMGKDLLFSGVIEQSEVWLDQKYCLKSHDFGGTFRYLRLSWTAGLGQKFNRLYNQGKLQIYNIHELIDGKCKNNTPGIVIYEEGSHKFYTVISNDPNVSVLYYDGIYSTPFSIDIE